ncbi:6074_t:CDS:2 [Funneliformis caledonium]|uniref:6074_t:CDS:1 n=1 Tax=Funneliformis caledonium TaxID=1117310 RepID=A0A9N9A7Q4_9GLOM|nr:6074_t:CDS:2 [Funneliformis caledonium]
MINHSLKYSTSMIYESIDIFDKDYSTDFEVMVSTDKGKLVISPFQMDVLESMKRLKRHICSFSQYVALVLL